MFRKILTTLSIFLLFFTNTSIVNSAEEFKLDVLVEYRVLNTGVTHVTNYFTLTNLFTDLYATSYTLTLENIHPKSIEAKQDGKEISFSEKRQGTSTTIRLDFSDSVTGKGNSRNFSIEFDEANFATRTGEVWEVDIPRLGNPNSFDKYTLNLLVPSRLGQEAYISPIPLSKSFEETFTTYTFNKDQISKSGISAGFGEFQVFSYTLNYHLENPLSKTSSIEIALPPDTAFQKIYHEELKPLPETVYIDDDDNWIATYKLNPRERVDVQLRGSVQIFSKPRNIPLKSIIDISRNLEATEYWQTNDPAIVALANRLKTPEAIYNYVSTALTYSYDRVQPNVERLGASAVLAQPELAICMEFTDLFIALARAAGIPAREINGFAYTENPEIQPLSLVADVLHAWPEYWSKEIGAWIPIDPTWGSTTGGVDFFSKLDLRHFTFVIHGKDSSQPFPPGSYKLGPNPQKDVFVNFGKLPENKTSTPIISVETKKAFPFLNSKIQINIKNSGPVAVYSLTPEVYFDSELIETPTFESFVPFQEINFSITVPFSFLGKNTPANIEIFVNGSYVKIPGFKNQVIIYNLVGIFIFISLIILTIFLRAKNIVLINILKNAKKKIRPKKEEPTQIT